MTNTEIIQDMLPAGKEKAIHSHFVGSFDDAIEQRHHSRAEAMLKAAHEFRRIVCISCVFVLCYFLVFCITSANLKTFGSPHRFELPILYFVAPFLVIVFMLIARPVGSLAKPGPAPSLRDSFMRALVLKRLLHRISEGFGLVPDAELPLCHGSSHHSIRATLCYESNLEEESDVLDDTCDTPYSLNITNEHTVCTETSADDIHTLKLVVGEDDHCNETISTHHVLNPSCNGPLDFGCPDGSTGGFYGIMRKTRDLRRRISTRLINEGKSCAVGPDVQSLYDALASLRSITRPDGWQLGDDDAMHILVSDSQPVWVRLGYEKDELARDVEFLAHGEEKLFDILREQHIHALSAGGLEAGVPSWDDCVHCALATMRAALVPDIASAGSHMIFRNMITDRDGTINNYCDRYPSSVQSIYNAVWVTNFARRCTRNAIIITAAPLGGRQGSEGLIELSTMPHDIVKFAGSKGREVYDVTSKEIVNVGPLPDEVRATLEQIHLRISSLCTLRENSKFLGLGSGLQRKFGEVTVARNDTSKSVSDDESLRFLREVQQQIKNIDPQGSFIDIYDSGLDIDICPRHASSQRCFTKGDGLFSLDDSLGLQIARGPNLICGDTSSDIPMIEAVLSLMSASRKSMGQCFASNLAVLFVVSIEQQRRTPELADKVRTLCRSNGAHCAILPSPDVLVAALAKFHNEYPAYTCDFMTDVNAAVKANTCS